jgi:hypothetical protein
MRVLLASLCLALLVGCGGRQVKSRWDYRPAHGSYAAWLFYTFPDGDRTTFIGSCAGEPQFMMAGGAWDGPEFTLTADGQSWRFHTSQGEHGHYLPVDGYDANHAIAAAKRTVSFQVGDWRRDIQPAEPLKRFVAECS